MITSVVIITFVTAIIAAACARVVPLSKSFLPTSTRRLPSPILQSKLPVPTYKRPPVGEHSNSGKQYAILRSESFISPDGSHYQYVYETENGISAHETGDLVGSGKEAGISATGGYRYTSPEGIPVEIDYQADVNGFQPVGNVLPTSPPIPPAILRSIQYIESHPSQALTRKY